MTTRYSIHCRTTSTGTGGNQPFNEVSPSTYALKAETYPTTRNGLTFGWIGAAAAGMDFNRADNFAAISGYHAYNSAAAYFRVNLPDGPGTYTLWLGALSYGATNNIGWKIYDGTGTAGAAGGFTEGGGPGASPVANGTIGPFSTGSFMVADASGNVTVPATFQSSNSGAGGGTPVTVTFTKDHFFIGYNTAAVTLSDIEWQVVPVSLTDASITDEFFGTNPSPTPLAQLFCLDPAGRVLGNISAPAGSQMNFSVTGAGAAYLGVAYAGTQPQLVVTTPIPGSMVGSNLAFTIHQLNTDGGTHDTSFSLPVVGDAGRPVTNSYQGQPSPMYLAKASSVAWARRKKVMTVTRGEMWAGYTGQTITGNNGAGTASGNNYVASDGPSFISALTSIKTALQTAAAGTWFRIGLQGTTWTGTVNVGAAGVGKLDFGTGGLLIEPDPGFNPNINCQFLGLGIRKFHWRNSLIVPPSGGAGTCSFTTQTDMSAPYMICRFTGNTIGPMQIPGTIPYSADGSTLYFGQWSDFWYSLFVEEATFIGNDFYGVNNHVFFAGGRRMVFSNNRVRGAVGDVLPMNSTIAMGAPRGVFADNQSYVEITNNDFYGNLVVEQWVSINSFPHTDWVQDRTPGVYDLTGASAAGVYPYASTAQGNAWRGTDHYAAPNFTVNLTEGRVYKCTVGGTATDVASDAPSGTGSSIVSGSSGVTWAYHGVWNGQPINMWSENNAICQGGNKTFLDANSSPGIQFMQDNADRCNCQIVGVYFNDMVATNTSKGIGLAVQGDAMAEFCTFSIAFASPLYQGSASGVTVGTAAYGAPGITAGTIRARYCVVGYSNASPTANGGPNSGNYNGMNIAAGIARFVEGCVPINWQNSGQGGSGVLPGAVLRGDSGGASSFTLNGATSGYQTYQYPYNNDPTLSRTVFRSMLSKMLHAIDGVNGAKMTESYPITITDSSGVTVTKTITVAP